MQLSLMPKQLSLQQTPMQLPTSAYALVEVAIAEGDIYCMAAVYAVATTKQQRILQSVMFRQRRDVLALARWEHTPSTVLQVMCEHQEMAVRLRLLRNPNMHVRGIIQYSQEGNVSTLLGLIAQHPRSPVVLLKQIALMDSDASHLKSICHNQAADSEVLAILAERDQPILDPDILANPQANTATLQFIYSRGDAYVRAAVLGHPNCPSELLKLATDDSALVVQRQLARDERMTQTHLGLMAHSTDAAVRAAVAANKSCAAKSLATLVDDSSVAVRRALAGREDLSRQLMIQLSCDHDIWVRQWLARNPALPLDLMWSLSADPLVDVRRAVARNRCCPAAILARLADDQNAWVRAAVAYQSNAMGDLMLRLFGDKDIDVLSGVATNPNTPVALLKKLVTHMEADVRRGVILNPVAQREVLLPLLEDPYYLHRVLLVRHHAISDEDRWLLYQDPDYRVRFTVFKWFADQFSVV